MQANKVDVSAIKQPKNATAVTKIKGDANTLSKTNPNKIIVTRDEV